MGKNKKADKYAIISAIGFVLLAIYVIARDILDVVRGYGISFAYVLTWVYYIAFAVLLFLRKRNIGFVIASGLYVFLSIYDMIRFVSFYSTINFLASVCLFVLILLNCAPSLTKKAKITKVLWFVPGVLMLINCLIDYISIFRYYLSAGWIYIVLGLIQIAAFILMGLWFKESYAATEEKDDPKINTYAAFDPHAVDSNLAKAASVGGADKLKTYKELLDSGVITQEEFDAKKKQILGL